MKMHKYIIKNALKCGSQDKLSFSFTSEEMELEKFSKLNTFKHR